MNEAIAIRQMPRSYEAVSATLDGYRRERDWLMKLAGEFAALDTPPLIFVAGELTPLRQTDLPDDLKEAMRENATKIAELERELSEAYEAFKRTWR